MSSEPKSSYLTKRVGISFSFLYFLIPKKEKFLVAAGGLGAPDASDAAADASDFAACACKQTTQNLENMKMYGIASLKQEKMEMFGIAFRKYGILRECIVETTSCFCDKESLP